MNNLVYPDKILNNLKLVITQLRVRFPTTVKVQYTPYRAFKARLIWKFPKSPFQIPYDKKDLYTR